MATSGTYAFALDIAQTIEEAFERAGVPVSTITGRELKSARVSLDLLLQDWTNDQINLWTVAETAVPLTQGTTAYSMAAGTVDLLDSYLRRGGVDTELVRISRDEYALLPDKDDQGYPSQFFVERLRGSVQVTLWHVPENSTDQMITYRMKEIEDAGDFDDNPDVPKRFLDALCAGLAVKLHMKRPQLDPIRLDKLEQHYLVSYERAKGEDRERVSSHFVPSVRGSQLI